MVWTRHQGLVPYIGFEKVRGEMLLTRFQECWPNPNPLANQLWCIDFLTFPTPPIIPHRLPAFLESLMLLKNGYLIHARWSKSSLKHSIRFCGIFPSLKLNCIAYRSSKVFSRPDCILKFTSCDNQALVGCIAIAAVAVYLKLKP